MRASAAQTAANEQALVRSLGDALNHIDQQLLLDVRRAAADHKARRATIFNELQALACSIGMFQPSPDMGAIPQQMGAAFPSCGNWRQAAANVGSQDEFEQVKQQGRIHSLS